jgi:hypothetical protein
VIELQAACTNDQRLQVPVVIGIRTRTRLANRISLQRQNWERLTLTRTHKIQRPALSDPLSLSIPDPPVFCCIGRLAPKTGRFVQQHPSRLDSFNSISAFYPGLHRNARYQSSDLRPISHLQHLLLASVSSSKLSTSPL